MSRFSNVPVEDDTTILCSLECKLGEMDVLYQQWLWDGITAESFIFINDDVAMLSDAELEKETRSSPMMKSDSSITIQRGDSGFTFVNFNFVVDNDDSDDEMPEVLTPDAWKGKQMQTRAAIGAKNKSTVEQIKKCNSERTY